MILEGQIVTGLGVAKKFVSMMKKEFYNKTKVKLYPGTLNIKLICPYELKYDYIIKSEEYGGMFNVQIEECKIFDKKAFIVRSEKNTQENGDYDNSIIEIVSNINLRKKYDLKDGQYLKINV